MSAKVGRNEPCPCGSGRKYKHCHLGREDDPVRRDLPPATGEVARPAPRPLPPWTRFIPWLVGVSGGAGSVALAVSHGAQAAVALAAGTALAVAMWFLFSNPPPPRDDAGDPAGLDFGRKP